MDTLNILRELTGDASSGLEAIANESEEGFTTIEDKYSIIICLYLTKDVEGDIVELGCHAGRTTLLITKILNFLKISKKVYACDSFEGFPEECFTEEDKKRHKDKAFWAQEETVVKQFEPFPHLEKPTTVKGIFSDISLSDLPKKVSFSFFDGDLYNSILSSFELIMPILLKNSIILIHDNHMHTGLPSWPGVKRAVNEMLVKYSCFEEIRLSFPAYKKI